MNTEALFLFLILLLGLVLYSFLGKENNQPDFKDYDDSDSDIDYENSDDDNYSDSSEELKNFTKFYESFDNYNHYSGSSSALPNGATYYEKNGGSAKVNLKSDGTTNLVVTLTKGARPITLTSAPGGDGLRFTGRGGETAVVINYEGNEAIEVTSTKGSFVYTITNAPPVPAKKPAAKRPAAKKPAPAAKRPAPAAKRPAPAAKRPAPAAKQAPAAKSGAVSKPAYKEQTNQMPNIFNPASMFYYLYPVPSNNVLLNPFNPNHRTYNNTPLTYFGSTGVNGSNINNINRDYTSLLYPIPQQTGYDYSNSLPQGIAKSQIPPGYEDLYVLKSAIVPPVCPAAPTIPREEKCPPCPPCARCPEPSFECKKIPNYNSLSSNDNNNCSSFPNNNNSLSPFPNYNSLNNNNNSLSPFPNYNSLNNNNNSSPFSNNNNNNNNKSLPVPVLSDFSSFGM